MTANPILLQKKYTRIIFLLSQRMGIDIDEALKIFYHSQTYDLMKNGISDMHCMSDEYLVEEILAEINKQLSKNCNF